MKRLAAFLLLTTVLAARGDDPFVPLRLDMNSRRDNYTVEMYQAEQTKVRVYFTVDGSRWNGNTNYGGWMGFGTNYEDSSDMVLSETNFTATTNFLDFTFSSSQLNTNGAFYSQVMVTNNSGGKWVFDNGRMIIDKSPISGGASAIVFQDIVNWDSVTNIGSLPWTNSSFNIGQVLTTGDNASRLSITNQGYTIYAPTNTFAEREGVVGYDSIHKAIAYKTDISGVTINPALEDVIRVYNNSGTTITNGCAVYSTGSTNLSVSGHAIDTIALADGDDPTKLAVIGIMTHDIADGAFGWAVPRGQVHDYPTDSWSVNDMLYLSDSVDANGLNVGNVPGTFAINLGRVKMSATNGIAYIDIGNWQADGKTERVSSALSLQRQSVFITNISGTVYCETELIGGGDMIYRFGGTDYTLDCTTGGGVGGRARSSALTPGTDTVPVLNYLYVIPGTWPACVLTNSTTHPNGAEYAWLGQVSLQSAATTLAGKPFALQRKTEAFQHSGRGRISYISERIRAIGAQWADVGCEATVTDDAGGNVTLAVSSGIVYQMHRQTFPAFTDPATIYVVNDPDTAFTTITNFNQITKDASGAAIANRRYIGVRLIGYAASGDDGESRIFAQLSTGVYSTEANALADASAFDVNTIPSYLKGGAFNIARVVLYKDNGGTWALTATQDKRGELLNALGTGGGASASTEFSDAVFRIQDNGDVSKEIAFQASGITASTTRTITMPDSNVSLFSSDGSVPMTGDIKMGGNGITNVSYVAAGSDTNFLQIGDFNSAAVLYLYGMNYATANTNIPGNMVAVTDKRYHFAFLNGSTTIYLTYLGIFPSLDNTIDLGMSGYRWANIYAATGTLDTVIIGGGSATSIVSTASDSNALHLATTKGVMDTAAAEGWVSQADAYNAANQTNIVWSWGYTDPQTTNSGQNIVRSSVVPRASTLTGYDTLCSGGSDTFDIVKWGNVTNAMDNYSIVWTGAVCSTTYASASLSISVSAGEQVGIVSTNGVSTNAWRNLDFTTP